MKFTAHEFGKPVSSILPQSSNSAALKGSGVDTAGYDEALVVLHAGTMAGAGTNTPKVQESVDDVDGDYADISGAAFTAITAANDNTIYVGRINCANRKRWLRVVGVGDGANAMVYSAEIILLRKKYPPVSQVETLAFNIDAAA